jgi:hypothetical protein
LEVSIKAISFYKNYFGVSYPLPKYDSIAIADFQCGAMENWGLVSNQFIDAINNFLKNVKKLEKQFSYSLQCLDLLEKK